MNGELAQLVVLAVHGSAWLGSESGDPPPFRENSAFQFVRSLTFEWTGSAEHGPSTADGAADWLRQFRDRGGRRVLLTRLRIDGTGRLAPHIASAFVNCGDWFLAGVGDGREELWRGVWSVGAKAKAAIDREEDQLADGRIWDVVYEGIAAVVARADELTIGEAEQRLRRTMVAARDFASIEGWAHWVEWLEMALKLADSVDPRQPYDQDLLLPSTPREISRLMASASQAWVFGGMGWWNDQYPEVGSARDFDTVTAALYEAVLDAIVAAANAAAAAGQQGQGR